MGSSRLDLLKTKLSVHNSLCGAGRWNRVGGHMVMNVPAQLTWRDTQRRISGPVTWLARVALSKPNSSAASDGMGSPNVETFRLTRTTRSA